MERPSGQDDERGEPGVEQRNEDAEIPHHPETDRPGGRRGAESNHVSAEDIGLQGVGGTPEERQRVKEAAESVSREKGQSHCCTLCKGVLLSSK